MSLWMNAIVHKKKSITYKKSSQLRKVQNRLLFLYKAVLTSKRTGCNITAVKHKANGKGAAD
jgi:hypothetical protein